MRSREYEQVSVELTDHEIRWLWYNPGRNKEGINMTPVIFEIIPLPQGIIEQGQVLQHTELTRILERLREARGIKGRVKVRIGIPFAKSFIREYTLPWVSKRERTRLLSYLADEEIPIPAHERVSDSFVTDENSSPRRLRVILSGIRKPVLSGIVTSFEVAGFSIETIGFSLIAWARLLNFKAEDHTLLIKEQMGMVQLILYKGQIPEITRMIPPSAKHYGAEEWGLEVQRILAYFSTMHEQVNIQRVVVSQGVETENLGRRICAYLSLERGIEPNFQVLDGAIPSLPRVENCSNPDKLLAVTGMALEEPMTSPHNFWRGEIKRKIRQRNKWIAVGLLFALTLAELAIRVSTADKLSALDQEVLQLRTTGESIKQIRKSQGDHNRAWNNLAENSTTVGKDLTLLEALTGNGIQFGRLELKDETLIIQGNAFEGASVQRLLNQLQQLGWEKARLSNYHLDENRDSEAGRIAFTFIAERVGK